MAKEKAKKTKKKVVKKILKKKKILKVVKLKKKITRKLNSRKVNRPTLHKKRLGKKVLVKKQSHKLKRYVGNPIIYPAGGTYWESTATFNPTAFEHDGRVHVIYRAVGIGDISTLGYVFSKDGYSMMDRDFKPIFIHKQYPDFNFSLFYNSGGGGNGGAEDPRVTKIDGKLYLTYTAFDGWGSVRIGLTHISLEDFLNKKWNWRKPVLISPPGQVCKNWVIFPEKIKGKYAILHSISPEILIDYVDSLDKFDGKTFIESIHQDHPKWQLREKGIRGVGPAPIKTKLGWLVLYHKIEEHEPNRYKIFAMILDLKDPTKILYRSKEPILEPDAFYENQGFKSGVIYSCGAVIKGKDLFVYYGGADMVSCVATANLDLFLEELKKGKVLKLKKK